MHVVMGATGNVGSAVAEALLGRGEKVTVVTRRPQHAASWRDKGALVAEADVEDVSSLRAAFRRGLRAFLLNPPADPSGDTDATERRTTRNILSALEGSGLEKVVVASTYGARPGEPAGDLTTLWELEEGLRRQSIPAAINRGAYYMTNWAGLLDVARRSGVLPTMLPANFRMPMVAPGDLGQAAAGRLLSPATDVGVRHVEGPDRYTPRQVAEAFSRVLGRSFEPGVVPRSRWFETFRSMGFSDAAASSYERMVEISIDEVFNLRAQADRGGITLDAFVDRLPAA